MINTLGNISLWLSLIFGMLQFLLCSKNSLQYNKKIPVLGLLIFVLISFFSLSYSHIVSDFSVLNVFENSHTTKPLIYKISGVWGNHEGSMLLWVMILCITNYFIYKLYNEKNNEFVTKSLQIQSVVTVGFLLFLLITSNPFKKMILIPKNGLGFNPILQDPALAVHPPLLYIGYVGLSAVFSLSVATMNLKNPNKIEWYTYMKPFVITAWSCLTAGIALGSIWAYYELGWGGWWFWDPVENAALMPWLLSTALLHSLISVNKNKSLQSWILLLCILSFLLSVIGTFLVRSGILTSVHTFALDPKRGIYILSFIALLGSYSLTLYAFKSKYFINKQFFSSFNKGGAILINNLIMMIICSTVFLGTIYPLIVEIFSNKKISVGEPYFNSTIIPLTIPAILIMGIGPLLSWRETNIIKTLKKIFPSIILTLITIFIFFIVYNDFNIRGLLGIFLSSWIITNVLNHLFINYKKKYTKEKFNLFRIFKEINSMMIAHIGFGILILGITGSSIWQIEKISRMKVSDQINIKDYRIVFTDINKKNGQNYISIQGKFTIYNQNNDIIKILEPENRFYITTNNSTNEVSIHSNLIRDLYIVMGDDDKLGYGRTVRVYYNPLVLWIWIGSFLIFLGGLIALKNNLKILRTNYQ